MSKETRRQQRIEELQRRWEDLHRRLGVLASSKINETRPEEQIRLESLIAAAEAERQRIEDELEALESGREPPPADPSSDALPDAEPIEYRYDVFLAHASADKTNVEAIARRLNDEQEPLVPFLDQWHLIPGNDWVDELGQSLNASRTCAVFFGPSGLGPWENEELRAALERKSTVPEFRVIPVLLPGAVMPDKGPLPSFLNRLTWVDFRNGLDDAREYHRLVCGIRGIAPGPEQPEPAITEDICPYLGLRTFQEEDEPYFFGRDALSQWLVEKLRDQRFLAVIGPSGSGKSSAVRAGLIPALKRGALTGSEHWSMLLMVPTANPLTQLAAKLAQWRNGDLLALQDQLAADTRRLHAEAHMALLDADPAARLLLIVDQFEELYTLRPEQPEQRKAFERERQTFLDNLLYAATVSGGRVIVTVAMRADFYARTAQHRQLADCMAANQVLVTPMAATELTEAIVGPARKVGLSFDDGLVDTLRDDVLGQPGSLPLLEHALKELWERRQDRRLTLQAYRDIGGISGALAQRAEAEYARLTPDQQTLARQILLRLVQLGEGAEDTRRRARLSELPATTEESTAVEAVVQTLSDARLLITARDTATGEELLDVSHEALIRNWPRLRGWLDEDRDALRFQRKLGERAEEWQRLERDPGGLLRGASLEEAENWAAKHDADMNTLEREFIAASVKLRQDEADEQQRIQQEREAARQRELDAERQHAEEQTRAAGRLRRLARLLAIVSVAALLAASIAVFFMFNAEQQQAIAEQKTKEADAERQTAEDQRAIAERKTQEAGAQRKIAEEKSREAEEQRAEAEKQRIIAERQSRLARARQLAAQSESYREPWLQRSLLLALEAATATRKDDRYVAAADEALREALAVPNGIALRGHEDSVEAVAFSPDGRYLASASRDRTVRLWDRHAPGDEPLILRGHEDWVYSVAFSPDGRTLASASGDRTVRLWDRHAPVDEPLILRGHEGWVSAVAFSPDGRYLASVSRDRTVRLWLLDLDELITLACRYTGRNLTEDEWRRLLGEEPYHKTCARWPAHPSVIESLLESGRALARAGEIEPATAFFQRALELEPTIAVNPTAQANLAAMQGLAAQGQIDAAMTAFAQARKHDPTLAEAADSWHYLCRYGGLWNQATDDILAACDQALELAQHKGEHYGSRSIVRALRGDFEGALKDVQAFIIADRDGFGEWGKQDGYRWISELKSGRNPFDAATLERLRQIR